MVSLPVVGIHEYSYSQSSHREVQRWSKAESKEFMETKCYELYWDAYLLFRAKAREMGAERM